MYTVSTDKKPIRVLMLVQSLPPLPAGGAEIQALRLARVLSAKGVDIQFVTPGVGKTKGSSRTEDFTIHRLHSAFSYLVDSLLLIKKKTRNQTITIEYEPGSVPHNKIITPIGWGTRLKYLVFLLNSYRFLRSRKESFDLIHCHTLEWPAYVSALLSKWFKKKLLVKDSTMNGISNILRYPSGEQKRQLIISSARFIAMTKVIEENFIAAGIPPSKIYRIPNGISIDDIYKQDYSAARTVLFAGNLYQQPAKGVDVLLKAWPLIVRTHPDARLLIAGDGDLKAYRQYADEKNIGNSVEFLGKYNDLPNLMTQSDVFVLPSRREGMPNALMEAMLRGLPCIATDISGCQDLISNNHNGLLVPPDDAGVLADRISFLLSDRATAEMLGKNARSTIVNTYDINRVADMYLQLYKSI